MSKLLITGIEYLRQGKHILSDVEHGIGGIRCSTLSCVMAALLLLSVMSPLTVQAADEQDLRLVAIAANLAAGDDIVTIIQNAVAAGLTVERAVEALVTAGADLGRVVYEAIAANFPASEVVQGAANAVQRMGLSDAAFLTQMATIVSAARQAGASEASVNSGLSNAGVSPTVIASANALAASSRASVFGYRDLIGGSGVGAPPTAASGARPASPTTP